MVKPLQPRSHSRKPLRMRVLRILLLADLEKVSADKVARRLFVSQSTLRRRLKDVGTTYQEFKDQTRCDAAIQLLSRPELKINAVAAMLGFDEPSAFHRSFKKWTGATPGEYRQTLHS